MNTILKWSGVVALVILAIMWIMGAFGSPIAQTLGSTACDQTTCLTGGLRITSGTLEADGPFQIGSAGSSLNQVLEGKCTMIASSFTVAASTTVPMECAVTGVLTGDTVFAMFATSTSAGNGWAITQASASTTAGFLTFRVTNNTGASAVMPASIASSSVQYHVSR